MYRISALFLLFPLLLLSACGTKTTTVDACGDGFLDPGEQCDGDLLSAQTTCLDLGYHEQNGDITCRSDCTLDLSVCAYRCGDGVITGAYEDCEGDDLAGESCSSLNRGGGTLTCNAACKFDTSGCEEDAQCGDGEISAPFEQCEDADLGGETCQGLGYYGGALLCDQDCRYDLTPCTGFGRCGDNAIQGAYGEQCEGVDLAGQTCEGLGWHGGQLLCGDDCRFDEAPCAAVGRCGDGIIQSAFGEVCDGADTGGVTCRSLGLGAGTVTCAADCSAPVVDCDTVTLVVVPGGTFRRNNIEGDTVTITSFRISSTEITRAQWLTVLDTDPSSTTYSAGLPSEPVQRVNWYHAIAFCNKLSLLEGLTPVYSVGTVNFETLTYSQIPTSSTPSWNSPTVHWTNNGYRLPTELEWMWAAMGAVDSWDRPFAGSDGTNAMGDYAVFGWDSGAPGATLTERTDPVASRLPNELGLYDMTGNVSEWVWDLYANYPSGPLVDYHGPSSSGDSQRVRRGGAWNTSAGGCYLSSRTLTNPHIRDSYIGFRVARN